MSWFTQNQTGSNFIPMIPPPTYSNVYYGSPIYYAGNLPQGSLVLLEDVEAPPSYEEHIMRQSDWSSFGDESGENYEAGTVEFGEDSPLCCFNNLTFCGICYINVFFFCCIFIAVIIYMSLKFS